MNYVKDSGWAISDHPVGNPLTGIRGDASTLPYNHRGSFELDFIIVLGGSFVYVTGPRQNAELSTRSFSLDSRVYFMFSYHKVARGAELVLKSKKSTEANEEILFEVNN